MPAAAAVVSSAVEPHYLAMLPEIRKFAYLRHRHLAHDERQEAIAETCAWAWQWCLRAFERDKLDQLNARMLSLYAARLFRSGRRFAGSSSHDALSPQTRGAVRLYSIEGGPEDAEGRPQSMANLLIDGRRTPPPESARVNLDYPLALRKSKLPQKGRKCFRQLVKDNGRGHVLRISRAIHVSPARVCQLKELLRTALRSIDYGPGPRPAA
jgi:hypothetical protein